MEYLIVSYLLCDAPIHLHWAPFCERIQLTIRYRSWEYFLSNLLWVWGMYSNFVCACTMYMYMWVLIPLYGNVHIYEYHYST